MPNETLTERIAEIAVLDMELQKHEDAVKDLERQMQSTRGNRTAGGVALLIGLLGIIALSGAWYVWLFLLLIGFATYVTAWLKQRESENGIREHRKEIEELRLILSQKKMLLTMHSAQSSNEEK